MMAAAMIIVSRMVLLWQTRCRSSGSLAIFAAIRRAAWVQPILVNALGYL